MKPIEAIVFDFDGTLVDASDAICGALDAVLRDNALPAQPSALLKAKIGRPLVEIFTSLDPQADDETLSRYVQQYRAHFFPISAARTRLQPGVLEALQQLSRRCSFGIATSRRADGAAHILESFGLSGYFKVITGIEEVRSVKPDPEPVLRTLQLLGVEPRHAVMVGDTTDDVQAGLRAGTLSVGVTTGAFAREPLLAAGADHVIGRLDELSGLVG